jgi:hypothetical protein
MRIYDGSPRQDFGEVFRAIGAHLDSIGMREILLLETDDGFLIQGMSIHQSSGQWADSTAQLAKETLLIGDDDIARLMDEAIARRGAPPDVTPKRYEAALRVIGQFLDKRKPRGIFFFEQDGAYVLRILQVGQTGNQHELIEFTRDDIDDLVQTSIKLRRQGILNR